MLFMRNPAVKFMICVFLPCAASFHTAPGILLDKAIKGDEQALERLLVIDKHAMLAIPEIVAICHDRIARDFKRYQITIGKYTVKSLPAFTKRKLKQSAATFLYVLMDGMKKQLHGIADNDLVLKALECNLLSMTDLQKLFTAFSRDAKTIANHEQDSDVSDYDSFRQAIHRIRKGLP